MHRNLRFIGLILAVATTGCMFHGDTPMAVAPDAFSVDNTNSPQKNLPEYPWWKDIGSAQLNELVLEALENNRTVSIAANNIEIAQSQLDTIRLGWLPSVSLMAGRIHGDGTVLLPNLPVPLASAGGFAAFLPMWVANIIQLPNQTKEAQKRIDATASDYLALRTSVVAQVVSAYAVLLASIEEQVILAELKKNMNVRINTVRSMTRQGLYTQISLNDLDSELQKLEAQIATNRSNTVSAKNALLTLLGRQVTAFTPQDSLSTLRLTHLAPGNTPTSVLATRPDVVAARAKIQAADYGLSATASLFAPEPTFMTANVRASGTNDGTSNTVIASIQSGLLSWTLDPQFIGEINTQNKRYDASIINYLKVVDDALKEVDDALANFEANQIRLSKEEKSLSNSRTNLRTLHAMFNQGLISQVHYLESAAQLDQARLAIVQTKVQAIISLSKLYQSMGGGSTYANENYILKDQTIEGKDRDNR
jgi:multidrug efflux system outer membrane protein